MNKKIFFTLLVLSLLFVMLLGCTPLTESSAKELYEAQNYTISTLADSTLRAFEKANSLEEGDIISGFRATLSNDSIFPSKAEVYNCKSGSVAKKLFDKYNKETLLTIPLQKDTVFALGSETAINVLK